VTAVEPPQEGERRVEVRRPAGSPYLQVTFHTPAFGHPDTYPLAMLDAVLSGARNISGGGGYMGRTARLYRALVETRLAASAGSGFRFMIDPYAFGASLTVREDASPEQAEAALLAALEEVVRRPPAPEELERVLRQTEALLAYGRDGVTSQAYALLSFQLVGHWSGVDRHLERLRAVRPEDVTRVAAEYLRPENRTVGWLLPEDGRPPAVFAPGEAAAPAAGERAAGRPPPASASAYQADRPRASYRLAREPRREVLENGIVLLRSENPDSPSVAIRGSFAAGSAREPAGKEGLAGFTARLLRRGTARRGAQEIAEAVESVGASFAVWGGTEEAGFSARCLGRDLPRVLEVLQEVLERPAFAESEIAKTRGEILTHLREQEDSTRVQAERAVMAALYPPGHPYSRFAVGTRESIQALGQDDFRDFHAALYAAPGMKVSIAGAYDADLVRSALERWFAGKAAPPPPRDWRVTPSGELSHARLPMPHKSQVDIIIGGPGIPRDHPDFFPLSMVNLILGSLGLMGRLGERVREQQGIAYYASCRAVSRLWAGEWLAAAGVAPQEVDRALAAILAEVERVRAEPVSDAELADAQDYLIGSLPLRMETNDGIAAYLLNSEYYSLGLDYIERYPGDVMAETPESLREAARRHMDPARFTVAMAGPL
jgi:zinc protease